MDDLLRCVYEIVKGQHLDKIKSLSRKIKVTAPESSFVLKGFFNADTSNEALNSLLNAWKNSSYTSEELAALILGASYSLSRHREHESTELVWTGPDSTMFPVRRSEQVLLDIINSANETLFIVSFVLVKIPNVEQALKQAIARGVKVKMLLESEDKESTGVFAKTLERLYTNIPKIQLYIWPRENREKNQAGFARVHAKCAVADQRGAFITSANLTEAALDRNIEMGINIEGGSIPSDICTQLNAMINSKEIIPYIPFQLLNDSHSCHTEKSVISLDNVPQALAESNYITVEFDNKKTGCKDVRKFIKCEAKQEKPKAGTLVIISVEGKLYLGNYRWNKQQNIADGQQYYLVTVKGFGPTEKIKIDEREWLDFMPLAREVK
ncbi:DISARM system phospholipase D-like protein DrmC [Vibrio parahaemolyticus]|uniref:DISARM system phospholipase D-like protein DrmC n=1 Tax=Vibrio parahaemolyticus TaxID=670 RepID=UPI002150FB63|nr:DISARM system phospholipase D-like protein DrmC [Vibrio parahaemolyticus]